MRRYIMQRTACFPPSVSLHSSTSSFSLFTITIMQRIFSKQQSTRKRKAFAKMDLHTPLSTLDDAKKEPASAAHAKIEKMTPIKIKVEKEASINGTKIKVEKEASSNGTKIKVEKEASSNGKDKNSNPQPSNTNKQKNKPSKKKITSVKKEPPMRQKKVVVKKPPTDDKTRSHHCGCGNCDKLRRKLCVKVQDGVKEDFKPYQHQVN
jgi:hypothetical protein